MDIKLFEKCYEMNVVLYQPPIYFKIKDENLTIAATAIHICRYIESKGFKSLAILSMNRAIDLYREQRFSKAEGLQHSLSDMSNEIYQIIQKQLQANNLDLFAENSSLNNQ